MEGDEYIHRYLLEEEREAVTLFNHTRAVNLSGLDTLIPSRLDSI